MTRKEAIEYLRPIAENATLAGYQQALRIAIEDMERVESLEADKTGGLRWTASRLTRR